MIRIIVTIVIIPWIKYPGGGEQITREDRWQKGMKRMGQLEMMGTRETGKAPGRADKKAVGEEAGRRRVPPGAPSGGKQTVPFDTQPGGQVGPVAVGDIRVILQGHGDLLVGVEADAAGYQDRPVLVAAQLDVMRALQQLLMHPSRPPPLPDREARPGPASPGRGLRRRRPRPGARGRCARSCGAAAAQARIRTLTGHRRQRRGGPAASQPSLTSARRGRPRLGWGGGAEVWPGARFACGAPGSLERQGRWSTAARRRSACR